MLRIRMRERPELVIRDGRRTLLLQPPWRRWLIVGVTSVCSLGLVILLFGTSDALPRLLCLLGLLGLFVLIKAIARGWRHPVLVLDEEGVQDPRRKSSPCVASWEEISSLQIKRTIAGRYLSLMVIDPEVVLARQGRLSWAYRANQRFGVSVAAIREDGLPISLEGLADLIREHLPPASSTPSPS
jgi:hypothetical protein